MSSTELLRRLNSRPTTRKRFRLPEEWQEELNKANAVVCDEADEEMFPTLTAALDTPWSELFSPMIVCTFSQDPPRRAPEYLETAWDDREYQHVKTVGHGAYSLDLYELVVSDALSETVSELEDVVGDLQTLKDETASLLKEGASTLSTMIEALQAQLDRLETVLKTQEDLKK